MNDRRPHENTYWVEPRRLLAGEYPGAPGAEQARKKLGRLLDHGIDFFIDLTEPGELAPYDAILRELASERGMSVEYRRMPIRDVSIPSRREDMKAILDAIDDALGRDRTVYVHCWGGIGRTGTVVGCHLVRRGRSGDEALREIAALWVQMEKAERRPHSPETPEQVEYVRGWTG